MRTRNRLLPALVLMLFAAPLVADEGFPVGPCGSAPPAKPERRKGGESFAPLPLPVTPLRRTEKKRPPSPPPLVAKIEFGGMKQAALGGETVKYFDWNKDPGDIPMLLNLAGRVLSVDYTYRRLPLAAVEPDPGQYAIVYYTGSEDFTLSDEEVKRLRTYVTAGGMIWGDTCYGDPAFFKAFVREMGRIFPERGFERLPASHPLFRCFYDVEKVTYNNPVPDAQSGSGPPIFYGVDYGCRTAVVLSRYDVSCGWDGHIRKGAHSVSPNDARKLGVNLVAYSLSYFKLGQYQAALKVFYDEGKRARGDFVFGQVAYAGNWDPHPNGTANLLREVATKTSAEVKFLRRPVRLDKADLLEYPFLYLTGHDDFKLSDEEVENLRRYLLSGGFLFADACCGRAGFDAAFRREIARVLPNSKLDRVSGSHAVFSVFYKLDKLEFTEYTRSREPDRETLDLYGVSLGGSTVVLYSPQAVGTGWRGFDLPFSDGLTSRDSLKFGVNTVVYAMTH
jgi:hypothetical protein